MAFLDYKLTAGLKKYYILNNKINIITNNRGKYLQKDKLSLISMIFVKKERRYRLKKNTSNGTYARTNIYTQNISAKENVYRSLCGRRM